MTEKNKKAIILYWYDNKTTFDWPENFPSVFVLLSGGQGAGLGLPICGTFDVSRSIMGGGIFLIPGTTQLFTFAVGLP